MKTLITIIMSITLLSGCSGFKIARTKTTSVAPAAIGVSPEVYLSRQVSWRLPDADVVEGAFTAVQSVRGRYGDQSFDLIFQLEKKASSLVMVGVTSLGQQLVQIEYINGTLNYQVSPLLGEGVRPAYLVSDFLLAFGGSKQLLPLLQEKGLTLEMGSETVRTLRHNQQPLVTVHYKGQMSKQDRWPKSVRYEHKALGYELEITTLSRELL